MPDASTFQLRSPTGVLPFGDPRIDARLPGGGLPLGVMHEVGAAGLERELGAAGGAFTAALLARLPATGPILWVASVCDLYAPGLAAFGLDPGRIVTVLARHDADTLGTMELALREGGLGAVVGEAAMLDRLAGRRLHLACQRHGTTAFVLRRAPWGAGAARARREGTASTTRWRIMPMPTRDDPGLRDGERREPGAPCWRVDLLHARGGREGSWMMEMGDAPGAFRVVSELGDRPAAATRRLRTA